MPGYSGTPLPKKLGIKDGARVRLFDIPPDVRSELKPSFAHCAILSNDKAQADFMMLFTKSKSELSAKFGPLARQLAATGMLWISWPKKSSGVATDLTEDVVRESGLAAGLVDVKVCAVTDVVVGPEIRAAAERQVVYRGPAADLKPVLSKKGCRGGLFREAKASQIASDRKIHGSRRSHRIRSCRTSLPRSHDPRSSGNGARLRPRATH